MRKILNPLPLDLAFTAALVTAPLFWLASPSAAGRGEAAFARLSMGGEPAAELPLDRPFRRSYRSASGDFTVEVDPSRGVRISEAMCPNKVCVHHGWARRAGETVVCLPGRVLLEVEGEDPEYDAVVN